MRRFQEKDIALRYCISHHDDAERTSQHSTHLDRVIGCLRRTLDFAFNGFGRRPNPFHNIKQLVWRDTEFLTLTEFNSRPSLAQDFTTDITKVQDRIIFTQTKGMTAMYDAAYIGWKN